jgi:hypothetical protein
MLSPIRAGKRRRVRRKRIMIVLQKGMFVFECDICGARFDHLEDEGGLTAAWVAARRQRWRAQKIGREWEHRCPECRAGLED